MLGAERLAKLHSYHGHPATRRVAHLDHEGAQVREFLVVLPESVPVAKAHERGEGEPGKYQAHS